MLVQTNSVNTLSVGGLVIPRAGLKILHTQIQANNYSVFYDASEGATPGVYQVPVGKTFRLLAAHCELLTASAANPSVILMYGDNNVGVNSASGPTNPIGVISGVAGSNAADYIFGGLWSATPIKELALSGKVPTGKYPTLAGNVTNMNVTIYGYEV